MTEVLTPRKSRTAWWVLAAIAVFFAAVAVTLVVRADGEQDVRSDRLYCTLAGVGLFDEAPRTGRTCLDLLDD